MASANDGASLPATAWLLAGLQAGVLGVIGMLVWLGASAKWQGRSFWTAANLLSSYFYGDGAVRPDFGRTTLSGLALYLLLYGLLGMLFAVTAGGHVRGPWMLLAALTFAVFWYYLSFHFLWKKLAPLVSLLHAERPTLVGHLLFGALLARVRRYLFLPHVDQPHADQSDMEQSSSPDPVG